LTTLELRRLGIGDLLAIEEIERRSYRTPWSRSMFAVMNVAVDPDHRGHGIATLLLERLFELTADDARRGYTLEVRVTNSVAIALYERLGFEARGVRRGYYTDNREDALIMWKDPVARERA
jgi:GNAT superfamily N-acetyltransferase